MASFFSFSSPLDIDVRLENEEERQQVDVKLGDKDRKEKCPVYFDGESVRGQVRLVDHARLEWWLTGRRWLPGGGASTGWQGRQA